MKSLILLIAGVSLSACAESEPDGCIDLDGGTAALVGGTLYRGDNLLSSAITAQNESKRFGLSYYKRGAGKVTYRAANSGCLLRIDGRRFYQAIPLQVIDDGTMVHVWGSHAGAMSCTLSLVNEGAPLSVQISEGATLRRAQPFVPQD